MGIYTAWTSKRSRVIRRTPMKTITAIAANKLGNFLARDFRKIFGSACDDWAERIGSAARSTIECLARSDALYHNYEHTLQVTMVGRDILHGMMVHQRIEPEDYGHLIAACLFHDIGYVRGVLSGDTETEFIIDPDGTKIVLPRGASDAALAPYHVDRSKLFVFERFEKSPILDPGPVSARDRLPPRDLPGLESVSSRSPPQHAQGRRLEISRIARIQIVLTGRRDTARAPHPMRREAV